MCILSLIESLIPLREAQRRPKTRRTAVAAFSLVEVTFALGIISFVFVTLVSLLPVGLKSFTMSRDLTLEAQIDQQLITEARQTSFSQLPSLASGSPFYFDAEGNPTTTTSLIRYTATIAITYNTAVAVNSTTSTTTATSTTNPPNAASITVSITKVSNPGSPQTATVCVANNGL